MSSTSRVAVALLAACSSGGRNPECPAPTACVCEASAPRTLVRAEVLGLDAGVASLGVLAAIGADSALDTIEGDYRVGMGCDPAPSAELAVGDEVLAAYEPAPGNDAPVLWLVPWADELALGAEYTLPSSDVEVLASYAECTAVFPVERSLCNDIVDVEHCGLSDARAGAASTWLTLLTAIGGVWLARRRRSTSSPKISARA